MGKAFERSEALVVGVTPDQVWTAIATGPGIDSWFMGRSEVADGSTVRTAFGGYTPEHTVTAWEPGKHLAYGGDKAPDGRFISYEFLIEGRDHGSTSLRVITSGFLPGDDWADEFEAMTLGGELFVATLRTYLTDFAGRTATPVTAFGPQVGDWSTAWARLRGELGLTEPPEAGQPLAYRNSDVGSLDGTVYFANAQTIGVRTPDALYRFVQGLAGRMVAMHHCFTDTEATAAENGWQHWLTRVFA